VFPITLMEVGVFLMGHIRPEAASSM